MTLPVPRNDTDPFDLAVGTGQLSYTFVFKLVDADSGMFIRYLTPLVDTVPQLMHDTSQTIKRRVSINFGVSDTAAIDTIHHRVLISLQLSDGTLYPLGRYMFSDNTRIKSTGGDQSSMSLMDEEFILDQPSQVSFPPYALTTRYSIASAAVGNFPASISQLTGLVLLANGISQAQVEDTPFLTTGSWSIGTSWMQVLTDLSTFGDYFAPWMDNRNVFRMIRTFDPVDRAPDFDWDLFPHVYADSVTESDDLLTAPNRFIVIGNAANDSNLNVSGGGTSNVAAGAIVGTYDVPASAPHSIQNRGFAVPLVAQLQLDTTAQAAAVARSIGIQSTLYQHTTLDTFPDPRHDSYNVVRWQGHKWLELAWSMDLIAGGRMTHTLRRVYTP